MQFSFLLSKDMVSPTFAAGKMSREYFSDFIKKKSVAQNPPYSDQFYRHDLYA